MKNENIKKLLPFGVLFVLIVLNFIFIISLHTSWNNSVSKYIPVKNEVTNLAKDMAHAHLWLEEAISGDTSIDIEHDVMKQFRAEKFHLFVESLDGLSEEIKDKQLIQELRDVELMLSHFYTTAQKRWSDSEKYATGSLLDQEFDEKFQIITAMLNTISEDIDRGLSIELENNNSKFITILLFSLALGLSVFVLLIISKRKERETQAALFESNEKAIVTLRCIGDAVVTTDIDGNITFINETAEEMVEESHDDVIGLHIDTVLNLENMKSGKKIVTPIYDVIHNNLTKLISNGTKLISKSGVEYIISDSAAPVKNADGVIVGTVLVFQDDTQAHLIEDELHKTYELNRELKERMELALIGSSDGIWDWNLEDNSVYFSPLWKEMLGYSDDELINEFATWESRVHPDDLESVLVEIQRNIDGETEYYADVHRLRHKDGHWVWILDRAKTQYDESGKAIRMIGTHTDISQERELQLKFKERGKILDNSMNEIFIFSVTDFKFLYVNKGALKNIGYTEVEMLDMTPLDIKPQVTREEFVSIIQPLSEKKEDSIFFSTVHERKDKTQYDVDVYLQLTTFEGQDAYVAIILDVTKRKKAEKDLQTQYTLIHNIIDTVPVRIFWKDKMGTYLGANRLFLEDANMKEVDELIGKSDFEMPWAKSDAKSYRDDDISVMNSGKARLNYEEVQRTEDGNSITLLTSKVPLYDIDNKTIGVLGSYTDITKQREIEESLKEQKIILNHQAHHDALTGLANRVLFNDRLDHAISEAKRAGKKLALLFIDLDHFKEINDSLGHTIGDEILKVTTQRLKDTIRDKDTVARLGGDEFTVIVEDLKDGQNASLLAEKILEALNKPIDLEHNILYVSTSIGISIYPDDGGTSANLLKYADAAMYRAKDEGRNNFQFYSSEMTELAFERVIMAASLREALEHQDFIVYYQPQVDGRTDTLIGMEALVRWKHNTMGIVSPAKFIPLAETTGLIVELDQWVMKTAMTQVVHWYEEGLNPGVLALNLSVKQLREKNFIVTLKKIMQETKCRAEWIELEVTEGQIMTNPQEAIDILNQISEMGIELAVDDFGTGYSSLSYLKKLPINKLKIDQSFVRDLPDDEEDAGIAKAVIALAKSLKLRIIAEGVEEEEQKEFLLHHECNNIQGYLYSKPVPAEDMKVILTDGLNS
ncbi:MAG: EAL domain-containing protein [Campylobacterota bacterium]|nr:EAL domain-containing protein [Campylobacterota bacterium]